MILVVASMVGGCACHQPPKQQARTEQAEPAGPVLASYRPARAGALVFDPPVISDQPPLNLSRDDRNPGAFVGYESMTATYFYIRTDDRQADDFGINNDRFERRSVQYKVGVSYR
jgi:hypothetical protein